MAFRPVTPDEIADDLSVGPTIAAAAAMQEAATTPKFRPITSADLEQPTVVNAASGFLGGVAGLGDLADLVRSAVSGDLALQIGARVGGFKDPTAAKPRLGDALRQGFDYATGIEDSTELGKGTYARKFGEYLPTMLGGGPSIAGRGLAGALKGGAQKLGLNALVSGGGYIGEEVGGTPGEIVGAVAAGSVPSIAKGIYNTVRELRPEAVAASRLRQADEAAIRGLVDKSATDPLYATRTLAEELQSPKLAQMQDILGKSSPTGNEAIKLNELARRGVQEQLLQGVSGQAQRPAEQGGTSLREILQGASSNAFEEAGAPYSQINQKGLVPFTKLRNTIGDIIEGEYKAGGTPKSLSSLKTEVNKTVTLGDVEALPKFQAFDYMHDLRERAQQAWVNAKNVGDLKEARVANQIVKSIDNAIESAPNASFRPNTTGLMLSADDVAAFKKGNELYSAASEVYRSGKLGGALGQMKPGQYYVKASDAVGKFFDGTPEGTQQLLRALPDDPKALDVARGAVRDFIRENTITNDDILGPEKFRSFIRNNRDALTAESGGKRLFEPEHIDNLEAIANDLGYLSGQSQTSAKSLANIASKGQSTTAQALLMSGLDKAGLTSRFGVKQLEALYRERTNKILTKALIEDKSFAKLLVERATPEKVNKAALLLPSLPALADSIAATPGVTQQKSVSLGGTLSQLLSSDSIGGGASGEDAVKTTGRRATSPTAVSIKAKSTDDPVIDTSLVQAVIHAESGGKANAVSAKGAQGKMQLMPATGREMHAKLNLPGKYDPYDANQNVAIGTAYLKEQLQRFGDIRLALVSYNWGPGNLNRLMKKYGTNSYGALRAHLPRETQDYVERVLRKRGQYLV